MNFLFIKILKKKICFCTTGLNIDYKKYYSSVILHVIILYIYFKWAFIFIFVLFFSYCLYYLAIINFNL